VRKWPVCRESLPYLYEPQEWTRQAVRERRNAELREQRMAQAAHMRAAKW
jgi:hypothetical protein